MKLLTVCDFNRDVNSGAAGSIHAINRAMEHAGHEIHEAWGTNLNVHRIYDDLVGKSRRIVQRAESMLQSNPDIECVVISQPYVAGALRGLRRRHPKVLFLNRTHGWEARGIEIQSRFNWDRVVGFRKILRAFSQTWMTRMCRETAINSHGVISASTSDSQWIRQTYQLQDRQILMVPYGLETANLPPIPDPAANRSVTFLYAGNYLERKGAGVLDQVLPRIGAENPEATIRFYVDPPSAVQIEKRLKPIWGERLKAIPWVKRSELYTAFGESKFMLLPSYFEGFGKTTLEALAMGCNVIGFREGALQDIESESCIVSQVGAVDEFTAAISNAASGKFDAKELSAHAAHVGRSRSWRDVADETIEAIERLKSECHKAKV